MRRKVKKLVGCLRLRNHARVGLDGVDYTGKVSIKRVFYSCHRPECPSCGVAGWAVREASRAESRLKWIENKYGVKFEHFVVSCYDVAGGFEAVKSRVLKALLVRGVVGGLFIYHNFRYHGANETFVGERAHYLKGAHFHVVGVLKGGYGNCRVCAFHPERVGHWDRCKECNGFEGVTRRAYEGDKCIVKVAVDREGKISERRSLGGTVWYELSHASLRRGVKKQVVVNWFGVYGRNKLKIPKGRLPQREHLCKICGEPMYEVKFNGDMAELLRFMSGCKDSEVFVLDFHGDGVPLWEVVIHRDGG